MFIRHLGAVVAMPSLRGGGEFGEQWHKSAVQEKRQTSFDDFIAAAEHLHIQGYTDNKHLVSLGGSNGGTLVAVTAN